MVLVRQRKPQYMENTAAIADEAMQQTKSFERIQFFLNNVPTVNAYGQLVNFFSRYSLQKNNKLESFLTLIKNATWHLLDKLVLDENKKLSTNDLNALKQSLQKLKTHGLSLKSLTIEWKVEEIDPLLNKDVLRQLKGILK